MLAHQSLVNLRFIFDYIFVDYYCYYKNSQIYK